MYATMESVRLQSEAQQLAEMILQSRRLRTTAIVTSVSRKMKRQVGLFVLLSK